MFNATYQDLKSNIDANVEIVHIICYSGNKFIHLISPEANNKLERISASDLNAIFHGDEVNINLVVVPSMALDIASNIQLPIIYWQGENFPLNKECSSFSATLYENISDGISIQSSFVEANRQHRSAFNAEKDMFAFGNSVDFDILKKPNPFNFQYKKIELIKFDFSYKSLFFQVVLK